MGMATMANKNTLVCNACRPQHLILGNWAPSPPTMTDDAAQQVLCAYAHITYSTFLYDIISCLSIYLYNKLFVCASSVTANEGPRTETFCVYTNVYCFTNKISPIHETSFCQI